LTTARQALLFKGDIEFPIVLNHDHHFVLPVLPDAVGQIADWWIRLSPISPGVDDLNTGIAKLACISRDDGEAASDRRCREKGVRKMVFERLAPTPLRLHNAGALSSVVQGPIEYPFLKEVI
jgi:hypothetical protein